MADWPLNSAHITCSSLYCYKQVMGQVSRERSIVFQVEGWDAIQTTVYRKEDPHWRGGGGSEKEGFREKVTIVKSRGVFLKNNCFSASPRKDLNKNLSFPTINLLMYCCLYWSSFFNYPNAATRDQSVDLDHPPLQFSCTS